MISNELREALAAPRVREFQFSDEDFEALRRLVKELTGINLTEQKRELVYGRLARRLRALRLRTFADYRDLLAGDGGKEISEFCNAITTNLTSFFRESHHFDHLREALLQARAADRTASRRIRIWSAGCSTGEEPYSIAMTILETLPDVRAWDIRILATDLDSDVLSKGQRGVYAADRVRAIGPQRLQRFFHRATRPRRLQLRSDSGAQVADYFQATQLDACPADEGSVGCHLLQECGDLLRQRHPARAVRARRALAAPG
jgi:chemotaxis protein methyltransferase CheR